MSITFVVEVFNDVTALFLMNITAFRYNDRRIWEAASLSAIITILNFQRILQIILTLITADTVKN
jgi:hypothetical protein